MENGESSQRISHEESLLSIPRGGPIFLSSLVSPPTRVPVFESDVFLELESLKTELGSELSDYEADISVDDLKIYSDEELVSEAMRIAFEDNQEAGTSSELADNLCSSGAGDDQRMLDPDASTSYECSEWLSSETSHDGNKNVAESKKRKGKDKAKSKNKKTKKAIVHEKDKHANDSYLVKLEHLAKIRQKQEEDKASVKLHSFSRENGNDAAVSSKNLESLKCLESSSWPIQVKCSKSESHIPIQYPEVVLCVEVYHNKQSWKKTQEFLVLGRQTLTELRDKIHCLTDVVMQKADAHDPSGYFLIEEVFCNDIRDPSAIDYSEPILDWLKNSKAEALAKWDCIISGVGKARKVLLGDMPLSKLPSFRSVDMQRTRFCDLGFRLGAGYLYCHQGDCRHVIVIRDMRLIHPDDVQNRAAYPVNIYQMKSILKKCSVCNIYKATKVTLDDKLAGENPCYFCDNCYQLLHYKEDYTLLHGDFFVHDYLQEY